MPIPTPTVTTAMAALDVAEPNGNVTVEKNEEVKAGGDTTDAFELFRRSVSGSHGKNGMPSLMVNIDSMDYHMESPTRGICLIFNNRIFNESTGLNERKGTEKDGDSLVGAFKGLGFNTMLMEDLGAGSIIAKCKEVARMDHSKHDVLVVCVLSHGDKGVIYGKDFAFDTDKIYSQFTGEKAKTLAGKPKLFFIQACQGDLFDKGVQMVTKVGQDECDAHTTIKIPSWADILVMYSTIPGHYSWRNPSNGSWFIQALVEVFSKYSSNYDLMTMLTMVNKKVAYEYESFCPGQGEFDKNKQVPCITSMLTRRLYFKS